MITHVTEGNRSLLLAVRMAIDNEGKISQEISTDVHKYSIKVDRVAYLYQNGHMPVGYVQVKLQETLPMQLEGIDANQYEELFFAAHVARIGVMVDNRRDGIARKLLTRAEMWALQMGRSMIWAEYKKKNMGSHFLFKKAAYVIGGHFVDTLGIARTVVYKHLG